MVRRKKKQRRGRALEGFAPRRRQTHLSPASPALLFPRTDAGKFLNITTTQRDQFLVDLLAAAASCEQAITEASHDDGDRSWE